MHQRYQQLSAQTHLEILNAEAASEQAINWATAVIEEQHSLEFQFALNAPKYMFREYDAMHQQQIGVYREAWSAYAQF